MATLPHNDCVYKRLKYTFAPSKSRKMRCMTALHYCQIHYGAWRRNIEAAYESIIFRDRNAIAVKDSPICIKQTENGAQEPAVENVAGIEGE